MKPLIDTIFTPVLQWLQQIISYINQMSVPVARPLEITNYLGPLALLGPYWILFISTICTLGFIYLITFIVVSSNGLFIKFKDTVKWW